MVPSRPADRLLAELGQALAKPGLAFQGDGPITLLLTDGHAVDLACDAAGERIELETAMQGFGALTPNSFLRRCLAGNFLWQGTRGASLLTRPGSGRLGLRQSVDVAGLSFANFWAVLQTFIDTADSWQTAATAATEVSPDKASPPTAPSAAEPLLIIRG